VQKKALQLEILAITAFDFFPDVILCRRWNRAA